MKFSSFVAGLAVGAVAALAIAKKLKSDDCEDLEESCEAETKSSEEASEEKA